jgi:hypothetical protein
MTAIILRRNSLPTFHSSALVPGGRHLGDRIDIPDAPPPTHFVETLNQQLAGRFGDNPWFYAE